MKQLGLSVAVLVGAALGACGGAPERPFVAAAAASSVPAQELATAPKPASALDDCEQRPGQPPPEALVRAYTGLAGKARCQREVYDVMGGVTHFLGVQCEYCHLVPDYKAMTHRKEIANWMASELIPALQRNDGKQLWCNDCHRASGKGVAKILGDPRQPAFAIEWMTTHLVEDFQTRSGAPLHCKSCHQGNVGTSQFERKIIFTNRLPRD